MKQNIETVDKLILSITIILSKNGHLFPDDDIDLLEDCLLELDKLKNDFAKSNTPKAKLRERLEKIAKLLDTFFGLGNIIFEWLKS